VVDTLPSVSLCVRADVARAQRRIVRTCRLSHKSRLVRYHGFGIRYFGGLLESQATRGTVHVTRSPVTYVRIADSWLPVQFLVETTGPPPVRQRTRTRRCGGLRTRRTQDQ
jgi:hypothetical protein